MNRTLYIIDNIPAYNRIGGEWELIVPHLKPLLRDCDIVYIGTNKYIERLDYISYLNFQSLIQSITVKELPNVKNDDIILFTDIRSDLVLRVKEYLIINSLSCPIIAFWNDGLWNLGGMFGKRFKESGKKAYIVSFERYLNATADYTFVTNNTHRANMSTEYKLVNTKMMPLPFSLLEGVYKDIDFSNIKTPDIAYNSKEGVHSNSQHISRLFDVFQNDMKLYRIIDLNQAGTDRARTEHILSRTMVTISLQNPNLNPVDMYHATLLRSLPVAFNNRMLDEMGIDITLPKIIITEPFLNYVRNRHILIDKITDYIENPEINYNIIKEQFKPHYSYEPFVNLINSI